jgi:hypothetical protein
VLIADEPGNQHVEKHAHRTLTFGDRARGPPALSGKQVKGKERGAGKTDQASALLGAPRNTVGSIGISPANNALWDREQLHQNMLVGQAIP